MPYVDTHAHLYHEDESRFPMIEEPFRPTPGIGTIAHLRRNMSESDVDRVVLVQTGSAYRWDNTMMAEAAAANRSDITGVCTLDPTDPGSPSELTRLAEQFNVKGLRLEPGRGADPAYNNPHSWRMFETARDLDVVICAHMHIQLAGELARLLERFRDVTVVWDHTGYLNHQDAMDSERVRTVCEMAGHPNLFTKLTFGITGSDQQYPFSDTHSAIRKVIEAFGPDRCMWGSDFPCEHWLKKTTYQQHLDMFTEEIGLRAGEQQAVMSDTARGVWFAR